MDNGGATATLFPYDGLRVIEISTDPAGESTGKLLAQYGAAVIKVEPPSGSPSRHVGPYADNQEDPERSLTYWFYNTSKRSQVLELPQAGDREHLDRLLGEADVLIMSAHIAELGGLELDAAALAEHFPRLVVCAITPFGLGGPWSDYLSSDLISLAAGGMLNSCGYDDHSIPPVRPAENQAYHLAATFAHIAIMLALIQRDSTGRGQLLDISTHESVAVSLELANPYWFYPRVLVHRQTCRHAQPTPTQSALFETLDGRYVYFALVLADLKPWKNLIAWMESLGIAADLTDPAYDELAHRQANFAHIQEILEAFFLIQDADTIYHEGQARGLPIAPVYSPDDVLTDEHLAARGFFQTVAHEGGRSTVYPGPPIQFSTYAAVPATPAPRLGEMPRTGSW
jgi:crotonobetainyl-CoA:carnitine CoA-transferase CaiB-like acyl-CoA transferase